jgi:hypothetical protein
MFNVLAFVDCATEPLKVGEGFVVFEGRKGWVLFPGLIFCAALAALRAYAVNVFGPDGL